MIHKKIISKITIPILLFLVASMMGLLATASAAGGEELIVELDRREAYPSQDVLITIFYRNTIPEGESYKFHEDPINMILTTSGLMGDIETTDYLLVPLIGSKIESGVKYLASEVEIHIPDDHGNNGVEEKTYDVYISNLAEYSNTATLKVLAVKEELTIELDEKEVHPGDSVTVVVKYRLLAPPVVTLNRPLSSLEINLGVHDLHPSFTFPGEVVGGKEITLTTYEMLIPEDLEPKIYDVAAVANPPHLESDPVKLHVQEPKPTPTPIPTATAEPTATPTNEPPSESEEEPDSQLSNLNPITMMVIGGAGTGVVGIALASKLLKKKPGKVQLEDVTLDTDPVKVYRRPDGTYVRPGDPDYPKEEKWTETADYEEPIYEVDGEVIYPGEPGYRPPPSTPDQRPTGLEDVTLDTDPVKVYRRPDGTYVRPGDPDYPKEEKWTETADYEEPIYEVDGEVIYPGEPGYRPPPKRKGKK